MQIFSRYLYELYTFYFVIPSKKSQKPQITKHTINNIVLTFYDYYLSWYIIIVTNHLYRAV